MARRAAKVDDNQPALVAELRAYGVSVQHLHTVGMGCPDILCGFRGRCYTFEIKDGSLPPSRRSLTPMEQRWHDMWSGQVDVIHSADEAMAIMLADNQGVTLPIKGQIK